MVNTNKKHKLQKSKQRLTDLGNDLNSIRVIRRNIVYVAGIPNNLSNEKTLRKKEYLGQYGKIVKIFFAQTDVSRQYYSSDSCIVYVTFSMEEEALRCIQVVNGYILDGRPLKASFGTTRYCYSWLNNLPCKNPDCLYVHEVVPQEDICSREEVVPFCTSKLQQCPGLAFTNHRQHSGSVLPPPLGTKNLQHPLGHISNNKYIQSDYFGRSYATVAASDSQSKLFSMNDNLDMPSSRADYFPSKTGDHKHANNVVPSSRNEMSLPKLDKEDFSLALPFVGICHSKNCCSPDYKAANDTNLMTEDNICRPSFLDNHMSDRIIGEPFFSHSDGNNQLSTSPANARTNVSAGSFNSCTNIGKWKCESLGSIAKKNSSEWDDLGAVSIKRDPFLNLQTIPGDSTSTQKNARPSHDWSGLHSDVGSSTFSCSFEGEIFSVPLSQKSNDFPTSSTIATKLDHKLGKPSAILPAEPMLFHVEQKNLCSRSSSNSDPYFEFTPADKTRDEEFLIESFIEQCEDRILSDILALDLDAIDDQGDKHSILEQFGSSDDLSRISNSSLSSTWDSSKSYFSMMDDLYAATGQLSQRSNGGSGLTKNSSCSEIMVMKDAYMEDSFTKFYLEKPKFKVLNSTSLLSATEVVNDSGSSLDMHHSGPLSLLNPQHPYSNSVLRPTLLTPPGFPPRKTNPGNMNTTQCQPHSSFSARCFSNTNATCSSHADDSAKIIVSATFNRGDQQNLLKSLPNSDVARRKNFSEHRFFQHISNYQRPWNDHHNSVSSNIIDFGVMGRNQPTLKTVFSVVPELQNSHLPSYF